MSTKINNYSSSKKEANSNYSKDVNWVEQELRLEYRIIFTNKILENNLLIQNFVRSENCCLAYFNLYLRKPIPGLDLSRTSIPFHDVDVFLLRGDRKCADVEPSSCNLRRNLQRDCAESRHRMED